MDRKEVAEIAKEVLAEKEREDDLNGFDNPAKAKSNLFKYNVLQWIIFGVVMVLLVSVYIAYTEVRQSDRLQDRLDSTYDREQFLENDVISLLNSKSCDQLTEMHVSDNFQSSRTPYIINDIILDRCL